MHGNRPSERTNLLSVEQLQQEHSNWLLVDARATDGGRTAYDAGHLEGAVFADLDKDLSGPATNPAEGGRHPLPSLAEFGATLGRLGIQPHTPVAIYDAATGALAAARLWWMLRAVGHQQVVVLNGGFVRAVSSGFPVSQKPPKPASCDPYPVPQDWQLKVVDRAFVAAHRLDPKTCLIDVRAHQRFVGNVEPIDPVAGHIPGAINLPFTESLDSSQCFLSAQELRAHFEKVLRDSKPDQLVVHCGSGVTACHTLLALDTIQHDAIPRGGAALYVGSWSEWCRSDEPKEPG